MEPHTLVLVRHGESVRNAVTHGFYKNNAERKKVNAPEDHSMPLNKIGLIEARKAGKALKKHFGTFDYVFYSSYARAKQTTKEILKAYTPEELERITVKESSLIRERNMGYSFNLTEKEIKKFFPWFLKYWASNEEFTRVPIGGESILQLCEGRLPLFLRDLKELLLESIVYDRKILVVSHHSAILGLRYLLEKWDFNKMSRVLKNTEIPPYKMPNCSATAYSFDSLDNSWLEFEGKVL